VLDKPTRQATDRGAPCARPRPRAASAKAVDASARKVIEEGGFGPGYWYFTHRLGPGIGLEGHEWPHMVRGNATCLATGMAFTDEPGSYVPAELGIRHEDTPRRHRDRLREPRAQVVGIARGAGGGVRTVGRQVLSVMTIPVHRATHPRRQRAAV
jgi:hypothetical protein